MKIAFLDVDGTLTKGVNAWEKIHRYFGVYDQSKIYHDLARKKEITYEKWASLDVELWRGRKYSEIFDAIFPAPLIEDAREGVKLLKSEFDLVYLVSGGIDVLVDDVRRRVGADHSIANSILHEENVLNGQVHINVGDSKFEVISRIAQNYQSNLDDCGAIGDDFNDVDMFKNVGRSIAFNSKSEELNSVADAVVDSLSFLSPVKKLLAQ